MISASKCRPLNSAGRFRLMHAQAYQTACPPLQHNRPYERAGTLCLVIIDTASFARDASPSLAEMRRHVQLQSLPVVVVGTGPAPDHGMNASALGGEFYIVKSMDRDAFREQLKEACQFALWVSALQQTPSRNAPPSSVTPDEVPRPQIARTANTIRISSDILSPCR